jgi:bifunctional enzyme CysN/CysC
MPPLELAALRFVTCGSVDDGKSTLIGRLLFESQLVRDDELTALAAESARYGTQGGSLDLALLVDGLQAEREQGITIDVAYRYFTTRRRSFIVADTPGHKEYTANMATGASTADLAVLLVDARKGILTQTRRHLRIVALMGVRHVVVAVNKMDLVGYASATFEAIVAEAQRAAVASGIDQLVVIPISALKGDNVVWRSAATPWYNGPTLLDHLEETHDFTQPRDVPFRMPVQWINRLQRDFRGVCGRIAAGRMTEGASLRVLPSGATTTVHKIVAGADVFGTAGAGDTVTITLSEDLDANRGDVLVDAEVPLACSDHLQCRLLWFGSCDLMRGRTYLLKIHYTEVTAVVTTIRYREDIDTGAHLAADTLTMHDIGVVMINTARPIAFEPYHVNHMLGGFILIDTLTRDTVGAGMIDFAVRRTDSAGRHEIAIAKETRALQLRQRPRCIWLTGLSGAGKSTIANGLDRRLFALGRHSYILDGDAIRGGLNRDLGFSDADRVENVRRVAEVARLMVDAGLIVIVALIAPFRAERETARGLFAAGEFIEVFVDAPLAVCEARDPKGLYAKARSGMIACLTGIDSPYEPPLAPDIHLQTVTSSVDDCVTAVLTALG